VGLCSFWLQTRGSRDYTPWLPHAHDGAFRIWPPSERLLSNRSSVAQRIWGVLAPALPWWRVSKAWHASARRGSASHPDFPELRLQTHGEISWIILKSGEAMVRSLRLILDEYAESARFSRQWSTR